MGFFDFLDQEAPPKATQPKRKSPLGVISPEEFGVLPSEAPAQEAPKAPAIAPPDVPPAPSPDLAKKAKIAKMQVLDDQVTKAREGALKIIGGLGRDRGGYQPGESKFGYTVAPSYDEDAPTGVPEIDALFTQAKSEAQAGTADLGRLADLIEQAAGVYEKRISELGLTADQAAAKTAYMRQSVKNIQAAMDARDEAETIRMEVKGGRPPVAAQKQQAEQWNAARVEELQRKMDDPSTTAMDRARMRTELLDLQQTPTAPVTPGAPRAATDLGGFGKNARFGGVALGIDPMRALKNATGSDDATAEFAAKLFGGAKQYGDFDLDESDDFGTGIRKFVEGTGPEGAARFYGGMIKVFGGGLGPLAAAGFEEAGRSMTPEEQNQRGTERTQEAMRMKLAELRDADPMRTTGGVLLFVLMSMLLGPGIATLLLNNRAKQGKLQDDVAMLKWKLRGLEQEKASMIRQAERREEQKTTFRQQYAMEDKRQTNRVSLELQRAAERWNQLRFKADEMKKSGEKNGVFSKMLDLFRGSITKANAQASAMDFEASKATIEDSDWYFKRAMEALAGQVSE